MHDIMQLRELLERPRTYILTDLSFWELSAALYCDPPTCWASWLDDHPSGPVPNTAVTWPASMLSFSKTVCNWHMIVIWPILISVVGYTMALNVTRLLYSLVICWTGRATGGISCNTDQQNDTYIQCVSNVIQQGRFIHCSVCSGSNIMIHIHM